MVITNAKYQTSKLSGTDNMVVATIDDVVMSVPMDIANTHYAEILKQAADSTITIAEAD